MIILNEKSTTSPIVSAKLFDWIPAADNKCPEQDFLEKWLADQEPAYACCDRQLCQQYSPV